MIPQTYPSILDSSNRTKMLVYQVPSITGLTRWVDYIPVKSPASESDLTLANTYANEGFILTSKVNDITGLVPFKDYIPIYLDSTATKAWSADNDGYIPMAELAGLLLDFTTGRLDSRITFSRTTNATVTNSLGTIAYAPHNLLTYSEQFDNTLWTKTNATIIANSVIAPDGTTTADSLIDNTTNGGHLTSQVATYPAGSLTCSIYVKANSISKIMLYSYLESKGVGFDVSNGTTFTVSGVSLLASYSITPAANGFYRCSITTTAAVGASATLVFGVYTVSGTAFSYAGTGQSVYIWGAQLEIGTTATTYNSTTVRNLLGFSELFDNAAWTRSNSFVQSNLLTYSEAFDNAAWAKVTSTVSANSVLAPNGYQTADTFIPNSTTAGYITSATTVLATATTATASIYFQSAGLDQFSYIYGGASADRVGVTVTLSNNSITNYITGTGTNPSSSSITSVGNGWYRLVFTFTTPSANNLMAIRYLGSTTANGTNGVYIWGAQLVQGSDAGAYRRTDAAALPIYYANHNGVVCAEKLVEDTANSNHYFRLIGTLVSGVYTGSAYFKKGERTWAALQIGAGAGNGIAFYNLTTGAIGTVTAGFTAQCISVGNGWYRCSITGTTSASASTVFAAYNASANNTTSYTGDGTSGIYIFGAQLSDSASLDPYVLNAAAAPSAAAYYGARFDYDPVTLAPKGLLIEEQRANLVLNSTIDGANLATQNVTVTAQAYTLSFYGTGQIVLSGTASATVTGTGAYPSRKTLTFTPTAGTLTLTVTGTVQYAQLEAGSFATSYIPTGASQATRTADVATVQGSNFYSWYNQNEGSLYANFDFAGYSSFNGIFSVGTSSTTLIQLGLNSSVAPRLNVEDGTTQANIAFNALSVNTFYKMDGAYKINDFATSSNGATTLTDTSGTVPLCNSAVIGNTTGFTRYLNGHIKSIAYYNTRLSDSVLKGLTA